MDELMSNLVSELKRGTLIINVLSQLKTPKYGYWLVELFEKKGVAIEANTLYPLLRRLEKQSILQSSWNTDSAKPRKYYKISAYGEEIYKKLCDEYFNIINSTNNLILEENNEPD